MENILIIGSSGHSKVVIDIIEKINKFHIVGLIDSFRKAGEETFNYPILGDLDDLSDIKATYNVSNCFIAIGDNRSRYEVYKKIEAYSLDFNYISLIHPSAIIGKNSIIGKGVVIMPLVIVNPNSKVGNFSILNTKSSIDHDVTIGEFCSLGPGVTIGGNVNIADNTHIGIGATVTNNVKIGSDTIIGAGALVLKNQPEFSVCYGVPCVLVRKRKSGEKYL